VARRRIAALFTSLPLQGASDVPLHRQIYERLREAILSGHLGAGAQLPSTRNLAVQLSMSRTTVTTAYDQLMAEGYLDSKTGSGTYVNELVPEKLLHATSAKRRTSSARSPAARLSRRGSELASAPISAFAPSEEIRAFRTGLPALDAFPFKVWARLVARRWRRSPCRLIGYGEPAGYRPLREAIASYLAMARGVQCIADQVIAVRSSQQAIDLTSRVLLDPGDAAWIEDPGFSGARSALSAAGAFLVPVPIDREGIDVAAGIRRRPDARLAYVCPSRQYPLGVTMTVGRRLALLEWAVQSKAWVIEDDYDSEFRYTGHPLPALQGLDGHQRVIYVGTFSKVLFPALRLGYLVVPPALIEPFTTAKAEIDRHAISVDQAVLADFMNEGHFARHIRRMRALYAERHDRMIQVAQDELADVLEVSPAEAGMHVMGWLRNGLDDIRASTQAAAHGVAVQPLSSSCIEHPKRGGLILGFSAFNARQIREGARELARALRSAIQIKPAIRAAKSRP
jgi:GntR family transcriptional regulator/MocR family aminotransferase